jgi:hypothetical protein
MTDDYDWGDPRVAAAVAAHNERVRQRIAEGRYRYLRKKAKACGARTRSGAPCRAKGIGRGGRCENHGGMSTGAKTAEGRQRIREGVRRYWEARRSGLAQK